MDARAKAWVCGSSLTGFAGSNPASGMDVLCCVLCVVRQRSASGWSLVQRSPIECVVSECDREAVIMRRPWPTRGYCALGKKCNIL